MHSAPESSLKVPPPWKEEGRRTQAPGNPVGKACTWVVSDTPSPGLPADRTFLPALGFTLAFPLSDLFTSTPGSNNNLFSETQGFSGCCANVFLF